jgi:hypothetical protein
MSKAKELLGITKVEESNQQLARKWSKKFVAEIEGSEGIQGLARSIQNWKEDFFTENDLSEKAEDILEEGLMHFITNALNDEFGLSSYVEEALDAEADEEDDEDEE